MSEAVRSALAAVVEGRTLSRDEARLAMGAVMDGEATPAQLAALLVALRMRGETVPELAGFATAMRERVLRVEAPAGAIDVVGTGGDGRGTFNISTASALVVVAAGVPVAKHGNRAITSASGSLDVLDALGIVIEQTPAEAAASLAATGFAFLAAQSYHPAMRHAGPTRREIGVRTAFNLLGPLTNPAGVERELLGVADLAVAERIAYVARELGTQRTFVVAGERLDELPLDGSGVIWDVEGDAVRQRLVDAPALAALGLPLTSTEALAGGSPAENAAAIEALFAGQAGPRRDVVRLNAGAALELAGRVGSLAEGVALAGALLDDGSALAVLERSRAWRRQTEAAREQAARAAAPAEAVPASGSGAEAAAEAAS
ncbi:MAG TPA: anthranilate phosphoribosyltransferase [Candidatus Limnocylindrales bacterium]|nr:anthranilate phosphoribosyltransferase [Candidatus Limnocylindrales bacterium]